MQNMSIFLKNYKFLFFLLWLGKNLFIYFCDFAKMKIIQKKI